MTEKKGGLGRGLEALFSENSEKKDAVVELRLSEIEPNKQQPRKNFDQEALSELAQSIEQHGLIQPLIVRPLHNGQYEIVAGERRWRASRMAGLEKVPVVVKEMDDHETTEIALIENLQRENLNPVEEALGYKNLIEKYNMTQEQIAQSVGKSRPTVSNALRLLSLKNEELIALENGDINSGHARALLSFDNDKLRQEAFNMAKKGYSVRQIEKLSKEQKPTKTDKTTQNKLYKEVEITLTREMGREIKIDGNKHKGTIQIEFFGDEDLLKIAKKIANDKYF